jgi:hypothetical protein
MLVVEAVVFIRLELLVLQHMVAVLDQKLVLHLTQLLILAVAEVVEDICLQLQHKMVEMVELEL